MKRILTAAAFFFILQANALGGDIAVDSLNELKDAITQNGNNIKLKPGTYDISQIDGKDKVLHFTGSRNTIDLTDVHVTATVGEVRNGYLNITGRNNTLIGGEFEDVYKSGLQEVTDFVAYNKDTQDLAKGLRGAVMVIDGPGTTIKGLKLTVRGSQPYGYGSFYGLGGSKRSGIQIFKPNATLDGVEIQHRSFGHGIFMQREADNTVIKNCLVEGRVRPTQELYAQTDPTSIPVMSGYRISTAKNFKTRFLASMDEAELSEMLTKPIPKNHVFSLSEDGIRAYNIPGSVTVINSTVRRMRGGIRLYLAGSARVIDCTVSECALTAYNLPNGAVLENSTGDFFYGPLSDNALSKNNSKAQWTITPSPNATGDHNLMDIRGKNHHITLNRTDGPLDTEETRAIVVTGNGNTVINKTEYRVVLAKGSKNNKVTSYGPVEDQGDGNRVKQRK